MGKRNWKRALKIRFKVAGFLFSLVGILMLITVPQELFLGKNFSNLELFFESGFFAWGIKIFLIIFIIVLIRGEKSFVFILGKYTWLRVALKIIYVLGGLGWVVGLASLFFV